MKHEEWLKDELAHIAEAQLTRRTTAHDMSTHLNLSSNDYLDLAGNEQVTGLALKYIGDYGAGSKASRLVTGTMLCHLELEKQLAEFKQYPAALLYGSGYLANAGTIPAVVGRNDMVFADKLVHASIIDAVQLSGAQLKRFRHNEPGHLADLLEKQRGTGRALIVTESVFSMDGDLAPLSEIAELADRYGAMFMVDEAHATGIFGPGGRGRVAELGLSDRVNISMGTLSKALGCYGGFVACSTEMRGLLVNRARAFIFTTAPPPAVAGAALGALAVLRDRPELGRLLLDNAAYFRGLLNEAGLDTGTSQSQIIPLMAGDAAVALNLAEELKKRGILAVAIRPPTVPEGTARIRFSVTLAHTRDQLRAAAESIIDCAGEILRK